MVPILASFGWLGWCTLSSVYYKAIYTDSHTHLLVQPVQSEWNLIGAEEECQITRHAARREFWPGDLSPD